MGGLDGPLTVKLALDPRIINPPSIKQQVWDCSSRFLRVPPMSFCPCMHASLFYCLVIPGSYVRIHLSLPSFLCQEKKNPSNSFLLVLSLSLSPNKKKSVTIWTTTTTIYASYLSSRQTSLPPSLVIVCTYVDYLLFLPSSFSLRFSSSIFLFLFSF